MAETILDALGSIPVDNVQALADSLDADFSHAVPPRYLRQEAMADPIASEGDAELPVIDFTKLADHHPSSREEAAKLHRACAEWGFFQLINHGVPEEVIEKAKTDAVEFFKLPLDEKAAVAQLPKGLEGYGQAFVLSNDQKLDWGDMLFVIVRETWFPVKPLPGALIANIGDIMEMLSNGEYTSIEHRATINSEKERLSIAAFHGPREDAVVGPFSELVVKKGKEKYKTMDYQDYVRGYLL